MTWDFDGQLNELIEEGRLRKEPQTSAWYDALEVAFPMGLNRIDWEKVRDRRELLVLQAPREIHAEELQAVLRQHRREVQAWLAEVVGSFEDEVIWIGDMTDFGIRLSASELIQQFAVLFSWPQHSYVMPTSGSIWCLNYTMEGWLYFGATGSL